MRIGRMCQLHTSLCGCILTLTLVSSSRAPDDDDIGSKDLDRFWPDRNWNTDFIKDPHELRLWEQYKLRHRLEEQPEIKSAGLEHLARTVLGLRIEWVKVKQKCARASGLDVNGDWWLPRDHIFGFFPPPYPKAEVKKFKEFMLKYGKPSYSTKKVPWGQSTEFDFRCYTYILRMRIDEVRRRCLKKHERDWGDTQDLSTEEITPVIDVIRLPEKSD